VRRPSPYPGAGPDHRADPRSVLVLEALRQRLMEAGMADVPIAHWSAAELIDAMIRNGVSFSDALLWPPEPAR
jgi:hypothetical protein